MIPHRFGQDNPNSKSNRAARANAPSTFLSFCLTQAESEINYGHFDAAHRLTAFMQEHFRDEPTLEGSIDYLLHLEEALTEDEARANAKAMKLTAQEAKIERPGHLVETHTKAKEVDGELVPGKLVHRFVSPLAGLSDTQVRNIAKQEGVNINSPDSWDGIDKTVLKEGRQGFYK